MNRYLLLGLVGLLSACANPNSSQNANANPYSRSYTGLPHARALPNYENTGQQVQLFSSNDFKADVDSLAVKGYTVVGSSFFDEAAGSSSKENIVAQANSIGAQMVLVSSGYARNIAGVVPLSGPVASWSYPAASASAAEPGAAPKPSGAVFLAKTKSRLGVGLSNRQSNPGALVISVIEGSPAFLADILPGDVLLAINNARIQTVDQAMQLITNHQGETVTVTLERDGKTLEKNVQLNSY